MSKPGVMRKAPEIRIIIPSIIWGGGEVAEGEFLADVEKGLNPLLSNEGGSYDPGCKYQEDGGEKSDDAVDFKEEHQFKNRESDENEQ